MTWLLRLFGALPLPLNHALGAALAYLLWWPSARHRALTRANVNRYVNFCNAPAAPRGVIGEQGKSLTELTLAWSASLPKVLALITDCEGWAHVEAAQAAGRPIIFVTPHLGCYDIAGRYVAQRTPITALYRPPKLKWLEPLMQEGRARGGASTAPADASGVRALLKTLKTGGSIMILPDQVPGVGDGVWADFFGTPAYTMTLLPRLALSTNAVVLFFFGERLPSGKGYRIHVVPMTETYSAQKEIAARQTNAMVEKLIAMAPAQYLWGYNRYKQPAGAPPSPSRNE